MIRTTLDNGLRVVVVPDHTAPVAAVAVHYRAGFRADPEHRPGLAHLLEHLMFTGAAAPVGAIEAVGGYGNASTRQDYTDFYTVVPGWAAERALEIEAARMRTATFDAAALRAQIGVVCDEIDRKMAGKPFAGFPWPLISPILYRRHPDAHNGYGVAEQLRQATLTEVGSFFETHHTPANAVLTVFGDVGDEIVEQVRRHFADIPARPAHPAAASEPELTAAALGVHVDPLAPLPAVAAAYRIPAATHDSYLGLTTLASILTRGAEARLPATLADSAESVSARVGFFDLLDSAGSDVWILTAVHDGAEVLDRLDAELADLAAVGPAPDELERARSGQATGYYRGIDQPSVRVRALGRAELLFGDAELVLDLPDRLGRVSADDVAAAAGWLATRPRAVLSVTPRGRR